MNIETLPKKLASYIHDTGMRALDHLAESQQGQVVEPEALRMLLDQWRTMGAQQKEDFVAKVSAAVGETIAASALLPIGIKVGKKAVKSAKKVLKKSAKALKKNTKAAKKNEKSAKKKAAKPAKPTKAAKNVKKRQPRKRAAKRPTPSS